MNVIVRLKDTNGNYLKTSGDTVTLTAPTKPASSLEIFPKNVNTATGVATFTFAPDISGN